MRVVLIAVVCAVVGVLLGVLFPVTIPVAYARYTAIALLAGLDSVFGAFKAWTAGTYEPRVFVTGLVTNALLAGLLVFVGDQIGVDLSLAAIVAFGVRIFNNLASIRRHYL
jgi:small basic protein